MLVTVRFDHFLWSLSTVNMQITKMKTIFRLNIIYYINVINKYPHGNSLAFIESD